MKIEILSIAMVDIQSGQQFYEQQQEGLGVYFLDSLFSDIDALLLYAGVHQQFFGYYRVLSKRFPLRNLLSAERTNHSSMARAGLPPEAVAYSGCTKLISPGPSPARVRGETT